MVFGEWQATGFGSYLQNRKQYVVINNTKSTLADINCGVPQGSVPRTTPIPNLYQRLKPIYKTFYCFPLCG